MKAWIVLPAYNEAESIEEQLDALVEVLEEERALSKRRDFSIVVVNDGSKDQTATMVKNYAQAHPSANVLLFDNEVNKGLAETLKRCLIEAVSRAGARDVIITMDADNTHPAGLVLRMVRQIREGSDVVIASRYQPGSRVIGLALFRRLLSVGAAVLFKVVFPISGVRDYTCGFRAYRGSVIKNAFDRYSTNFISERGFSCMVDILLRLRHEPLVFSEVPLILRYDRKKGQSKMKVVQTVVDTLKLMFRRRFAG